MIVCVFLLIVNLLLISGEKFISQRRFLLRFRHTFIIILKSLKFSRWLFCLILELRIQRLFSWRVIKLLVLFFIVWLIQRLEILDGWVRLDDLRKGIVIHRFG